MNYSPLRYPGGKMKLAPFVTEIIKCNGLAGGCYIEPFAGGANIAFHLLYHEYVQNVILNDLDRSIYFLWDSILNHTSDFIEMIHKTPVTMDQWYQQKEIQKNKDKVEGLELAFSTFFLNRTNRSGIINSGGVIGGTNQSGKWKIDARYNKDDLIQRIKKISLYSSRICLSNQDAEIFINENKHDFCDRTLIYFDPPYYAKGSALYANFYKPQDHKKLSEMIHNLEAKWLLTYDYEPEIIKMYEDTENKALTIGYSVAEKKQGIEFIAFSPGLIIPAGNFSTIRIA